MRIVLIGDVGWSRLYHLGDEAMTDYAIEALRDRGVQHITLIAGEPEVSADFYGVEAIRRIGFRNSSDRSAAVDRLEQVRRAARGRHHTLAPDDSALAVIEAVRDADAVLIGGGGNLNSFFPQHIYERAALAEVARALGKPYALTSQTVGPLVRDDDRPVLAELLQGAVVVGAREQATAELLLKLGVQAEQVVRTMDDAYGLAAQPGEQEAVRSLTSEPFVIASFAEKASTTLITQDDYHALAARTMTELADVYDATVLLVPHAGTLRRDQSVRDQESNQVIAAQSSDRVRTTAMLTARELAALTDKARLVVGTRYHPAIFAARSAVPAISIAPNMYSSVRMRRSAVNVGLQDFVLSLDTWRTGGLTTAARELRARDEEVRAHLGEVREQRVAEQAFWWDALVEALRTGQRPPVRSWLTEVTALRSTGDWAATSSALLDATERYDELRMTQKWKVEELEQRVTRLRRQRNALQDELAKTAAAPAPSRSVLHRVAARVRRVSAARA